MTQYIVYPGCFWNKTAQGLSVVKDNDNGIFKLSGLAEQVFLAVATEALGNLDQTNPTVAQVLIDLQGLSLIVKK